MFDDLGGAAIANLTHLVMQPRDLFERPWLRGAAQGWRVDALAQLGNRCLDVTGQLGHAPMQLGFERREPRFGALDAGLGRPGCRHTELRQALGLRLQLPGRFLVKVPEEGPFLLDDALEGLKSPGRLALKAGLDVAPAAEPRLELADRMGVPLAGGRPLLQNLRALFREMRQAPFHRLQVLLRFAPMVKGQAEAIDLRLEIGQALFEARDLRRVHVLALQRMIHKSGGVVHSFLHLYAAVERGNITLSLATNPTSVRALVQR